MGLAMYQDADGKEQLPPRLTSEGARVDPVWLLKFLKDPSMSPTGGAPVQGAIKAAMPNIMAHLTGATGSQTSSAVAGVKPAPTGAKPAPAAAQPAAQPAAAPLDPPSMLSAQVGANKNGVRGYLKARMPTFNFSPNELQALVNFFMGASAQQMPYIPEPVDPLTNDEQTIARSIFTSQAAPCLKCHMTGDPAHDAKATAPNFLLARERLKPAWTERWLIAPDLISPGTSMPSGLFERDTLHERWVTKGVSSPAIQTYNKDHVNLLVRYMFQISPEEQRRLMASGSGGAAAAPPAAPAGAKPAEAKKTASANTRRRGSGLSTTAGGR